MSIFDNMNQTSAAPPAATNDVKVENFFSPIKDKAGNPLKLWKPKAGPNYIDLIPFQMATDKFAVADKFRVKGNLVFDILVDVNWNRKQGNTIYNQVSRSSLGLGDDPYQDEQVRLFAAAKEKGITGRSTKDAKKACPEFTQAVGLFPKSRSLYLIAVYSDDKQSRSFHLYSPAFHSFGKLLKEKKEAKEQMGENINWGHPVEGPTIFINGVEKEYEGSTFVGFDSIDIMPRIKPYPEDIYTKVPSLDEYINVPTVDEAYMSLFGTNAPTTASEEETMPTIVVPEETPVAPVVETPPVATTTPAETKVEEATKTDWDDLPF